MTDEAQGLKTALKFNYNREFRKKHEVAQVTAQLQGQVKLANLSRKHEHEMLNELQRRGQAIRDD